MASSKSVRQRRGPAGSSAREKTGSRSKNSAGHRQVRMVAIAGTVFVLVFWLFLWNLFHGKEEDHVTSPVVYTYRIIQKYRHDPGAFTQGLLWLNDSIYESTGLYGRSSVRELQLQGAKAKVTRRLDLAPQQFGEGLAYWRGELLQLLWRTGEGLRYSVRPGSGGHLQPLPSRGFWTPLKDGWGLTTDETRGLLLATDSGHDVFFLDPENLSLNRSLSVTDNGSFVEMLNELEVIDGELWANVFGKDCLARIDLESGSVVGWVLLTGLRSLLAPSASSRERPDVLNGIAWDEQTRRLLVTGKLWPLLFEIEVVPTTNISLAEARSSCLPTRNIF